MEDIKKDYEDSDLFCIRVDLVNDDDTIDKAIVVYPVPYLVTLDDLYVFIDETKIYCSLEYNANEDGDLELTASTYCILDPEGEKALYTEWIELLDKFI